MYICMYVEEKYKYTSLTRLSNNLLDLSPRLTFRIWHIEFFFIILFSYLCPCADSLTRMKDIWTNVDINMYTYTYIYLQLFLLLLCGRWEPQTKHRATHWGNNRWDIVYYFFMCWGAGQSPFCHRQPCKEKRWEVRRGKEVGGDVAGRKGGRTHGKFMAAVKEDMLVMSVTYEERTSWEGFRGVPWVWVGTNQKTERVRKALSAAVIFISLYIILG